jgi:hypothetical protein
MSFRPVAGGARRRLAQRIRRFLDGLAQQNRDPNRLESHLVLDALSYLHAGQWTLGEDAISRAEQAAGASRDQLAGIRPAFDPVTVARLQDHLGAIVARQDEVPAE